MADKDEQTETATQKKLDQLHQDGKAPKSQDVNTVGVLLAVGAALVFMGADLAGGVMATATRMFQLEDRDQVLQALPRLLPTIWLLGIPLFAATFSALTVGVAQTRAFTLKSIAFKLDKLNPIPNFKKLLPNKETLLELAKQVVKLLAVGGTAYSVVIDTAPGFSILPVAEVGVAAVTVARAVGELTMKTAAAFAVVAILDYLLARRKFLEDAKMSKQEVKDERKQQDISPEVRNRMRRRMMEMRGTGAGAVEDATVLVTNPTHYAVALRYEPDTDAAPLVLSKGMDKVAQRMRQEARHHDVPIIENRPLARALFADAKIGEPIPLDFYRAVAEVIAFVMQLRARRYGTPPVGAGS